MASEPLAYLITFRCFGSWLPGAPRGTTDRAHNDFGQPHIARGDLRREFALRRMRHPELVLDAPMRAGVRDAIVLVCQNRNWQLWAVNVRTNHIHLVVSAASPSEAVMDRLKSSATFHLRQLGLSAAGVRLWSRHGSTLSLWTELQRARAVDYTLNRQD